MNNIRSACKSFLYRNKDHIIAIIFRWQTPFKDRMSGWVYRVLRNSNYAHNQSQINILEKLESKPTNPDWVNIDELIREQFKLKRENYS